MFLYGSIAQVNRFKLFLWSCNRHTYSIAYYLNEWSDKYSFLISIFKIPFCIIFIEKKIVSWHTKSKFLQWQFLNVYAFAKNKILTKCKVKLHHSNEAGTSNEIVWIDRKYWERKKMAHNVIYKIILKFDSSNIQNRKKQNIHLVYWIVRRAQGFFIA